MNRMNFIANDYEEMADDHDKAGQVYAKIRSILLSCRVTPSTFLNIRTLAKALHVSPTPVREALIRLANEQIIMQAPAGRGYFSRVPSVEELAAEYEAAFMIISHALRKNGREFSLLGMRLPPGFEQDAGALEPRSARTELYVAFLEMVYQRIGQLSSNPTIQGYMHQFIDRTSFIREFDLQKPHRLVQITTQMRMFLDFLAQGDVDGAISNLHEQYETKIKLLPELVLGVMQRAMAENRSVEALIPERPAKG